MKIIYKNTTANLEPTQLEGFFEGWPNPPSLERHLEVLRGSFAIWLAFEVKNDFATPPRCVGFITAVSDGALSAFIPLLEVLPAYRGRGIGTELLRRMDETLQEFYSLDVVCDEPLVEFYHRHGFTRGVAMLKRRYGK